jgi:RND family efflux transporter MFP subunit
MYTYTKKLIVPVVAAATLVAAGCGHDEAHTAAIDLEPVTVRTTTVEHSSLARPIELRGLVQPAREAFVSSRVMGPVVAIRVKAGDTVGKGRPLVEIQPETAEGQLAQAEGARAQARAALALAERNFKRFEALHAEGAASDLELDMARMEHERARGAVDQAEGAVMAADSVATESVVRAPFAGRVVDTLVEVGDLAAPGRPLVRFESTAGQEIWLTVREADIHRFSTGLAVDVRLDARADLGTIPGTVREIIPSADPATHTFTIKVTLPDVSVPSGLSGRAVVSGDISDRLVIPAGAVHHRGGLELVVVRAADGTARTRAVTTGRALDGERIEILSGLDAGESVVLNAPRPLADGTPLEVSP